MARTSSVGVGLSLIMGVLLLPGAASAQQATASGIAGVVRDTSGAVLPGVTVEAASPALIEKARSVVSDGEGRYNIVDLRPGTYVVTFTLTGFSTFRRDGIELSAGFTATVNAEMKVRALEETITVTGEAPLVDTQNVRKQTVVSSDLLNVLPSSVIAPTLGRNLAACGTRAVCTNTVTVPLIVPQTLFEDRMSRLDVRVAKRVQLTQRVRLQANFNVYNVLNGSAVAVLNTTYGSRWLEPSRIEDGRMVQFNGSLTF